MMRTWLPARLALLSMVPLVVSLLGAGCGGAADDEPETDAVQHEAQQDAHADHGVELPAAAGPGYTEDDVRFMQMMIAHHDQAVRMASMVAPGNAGPEVTALAQRMDISQRDEIRFMEGWLQERGQAVPDGDQRRSMRMPGLVTPEQFERLDAARGPDFDQLFLELMIEHHVGALEMVDDLFMSPGSAQDSELFQFATDVGADQLDEIGIMERLLERFDSDSRPD